MVAQNMFRTYDVKSVFSLFGFDETLDVIKCFQQIEMPDLIHMCA